jgi:predicted oxidoreductase
MTVRADIVVVGAGIAGAAALIEAAASGASVVGLDSGPGFGGTARRGGGGICIPGSTMQREQGIVDDPELAFRDLAANGNVFDDVWARRYFENAAVEVFDWLHGLGIVFADIRHIEGDSVPRWHGPVGQGAGAMASLWTWMVRNGLDRAWRFGQRVVAIEEEGGRRLVTAQDGAGRSLRIEAGAVVMATGGFAGNLDMVEASSARITRAGRVLAAGGPAAQGEGHRMLASLGARLDHLENVYAYATGTPDYSDPTGRRGVIVRGVRDWVWLNRQGRRFHDESRATSGKTATPAVLAQEGGTCWALLDAAMAEDLLVADHYREPGSETTRDAALRLLAHSPLVWRTESVSELAVRIGLDRAASSTVSDWNALLASGAERDPLTGRALAGLRPLAKPPFTAIQFLPSSRKTLGGVQTDLACRVLDTGGRPMPGLFAAGELCGMAGGHIAGSLPLEGMMVGASCFSGRIAGREAARYILSVDSLQSSDSIGLLGRQPQPSS